MRKGLEVGTSRIEASVATGEGLVFVCVEGADWVGMKRTGGGILTATTTLRYNAMGAWTGAGTRV